MNPNQSETKFSIRTNPKNFLYLVWWKMVKNRSDLIRFNPRQLSEWIQTNPNHSDLQLIWIENLVSDWFGFIRIDVSELIRLSRIDFWPFFIKRETKSFSDWFGIIRIGSDTDIGIIRNSFVSRLMKND